MDELRVLQTTAFISGASVMVVEILGSRLFAPYFGSSTYVWSALIGVILASLSLGYYIGGRQADVNPSKRKLSSVLLAASALVFAIPLLAPHVAAFSLVAGYRVGPLIYALILFSLPNVLLGIVPPYTIKLAAKSLGKIGSVAGDLYALSTVGSIVGTLMTGFVLIPLLPVTGIFIGVALALFIASVIVWKPSKYNLALYLGVALIISAASLSVGGRVWLQQGEKKIYEKYTPYQRILVVDDEAKKTRKMVLDFLYSGEVQSNTNLTVYDYIKFYEIPFILRGNISSVYMIGEGSGTGALQIRMAHPNTRVLVAELDPEVHKTAVDYFSLAEDENLVVELGDGRQILQQSSEQYDLVILDAFRSIYSIPTHLTTAEFFRQVRTHLKPEGVLEINAVSSLDDDSIFLKSLCKTMENEFKYVYFYPVDSTLDSARLQNIMVLASNKQLETPDRSELSGYNSTLFEKEKLWDMVNHRITWYNCSEGMVMTDDYSPTDYLIEPMMGKAFTF
ncbi:MAG: fused MFS/spermidine synthase [Candidatus Altiarchaeota archaeon]